ncbi:MAG: oligosaccharide flippase family protein [Bacteroidales bacterium]|jgi:O-antigen/teichoic acid export membrane protein|nr:oligosaccharide flippase family protein [Bacteroidales bacterium]
MLKSNDSNTQQAFWVGIGSLFSFGFTLISSMILSRYFSKEDYGTYRQVLYVYNTLLIIFTLGLPTTFSFYLPRIPLNEAKSLIRKLTNLFFLLGAIFSLLLFVLASQIALFLKNPDLELALKIFSPVPVLMLPTMGLEGILSTFRKTQFLTVYTISTRILMLLCVALPVIFFHSGYIQSIIGFVVASFLSFALALYFKYMPVKNAGNEKTSISYNEIFKFSLPLLYASLWGMLISSADQFFISRYFGTEVFAEFSNGSMELPFTRMVIGACATVLTPIFSRLSHEKLDPRKEIFPLWISVFEKTAKIIYPLVLYCWFFADILMMVLYGNQYENSTVYFRIKSLINFFTLIIYAPLLIALGKTKFYANVHMYSAIILIAFEYLSILIFKSPYLISGISVACQLGRIFVILLFVSDFFELKLYKLFPIRLLLKIILPSILILFTLHYLLVNYFSLNKLLILLISCFGYIILFFACSYFLKIDYMIIINPFNKHNNQKKHENI